MSPQQRIATAKVETNNRGFRQAKSSEANGEFRLFVIMLRLVCP